jgi:hypothetical protein
VILSEDRIPTKYRVILVGDSDLPYIIYSEQRNIWKGKTFVWEYTGMDQTDIAEVINLPGGIAASGQQINTAAETLYQTPVNLFRNTSTDSSVHDDADFSKSIVYMPLNRPITTDMELQITSNGNTNSYTISEVTTELFCQRLSVIER